jgi:hypothetical protein
MSNSYKITNTRYFQSHQWITNRLTDRIAVAAVAGRYEAGLYGPLNHILFDHFPTMRNFMIKPQGVLYRQLPIAQRHHVRNQSYGGETGGIFGVPDFIICKSSRDPSEDTIVTIVEVKRTDQYVHHAVAQIAGYMLFSPEQDDYTRGTAVLGPAVGCLYGFLVLGPVTRIYRYDVEAHRQVSRFMQWFHLPPLQQQQQAAPPFPNAIPFIEEIHNCATTSPDLKVLLARISLKYWDIQGNVAWNAFAYRNLNLLAQLPHLNDILNYQ